MLYANLGNNNIGFDGYAKISEGNWHIQIIYIYNCNE